MLVEVLIFLLTALVAYYWIVHKRIQQQFNERDVRFLPGVPVLGNAYKSTTLKRHVIEDIDEVYKAFPDERYVGYIEGTTPIILVRDPDLIKKITVKDFDYFTDHNEFFPVELEPIFGSSLLMLKGDKWRDMRTTLSPAFTGSKMKLMMPFMTEISKNIVEDLKGRVGEDLDVDDVMRRYTTDVIASAGFGLQVNSLKDRNNDFFTLGQNLFNFTVLQRIYFVLGFTFPYLLKMFKITLFPKKITDFFRNIVLTTMEQREKNNVVRPDMIHLLMEASKGTLTSTGSMEKDDIGFATVQEDIKHQASTREWTQDELVGQVFIFFVAGFETSASSVIMCIHELALNPEIQEKLYQEIRAFKETKSDFTYDNINDLKYLDCVLNETFRKWSAAIIMDRVANREYILPPPRPNGKSYTLKPGDVVYNLVNSLHMDPKYFPNPEVFNPDRFSDENKHKIKPFTFAPFGAGPRACIGSRFALLELKVLLCHLVLNFKILKGPKTSDPIKLLPKDFNIKAQGGTCVRLENRC